MIDHVKRVTLKRIGSLAIAVTAASASAHALSVDVDQKIPSVGEPNDASVANIDVYTRVSAVSNDLEVVISNASDELTHITQMTPSQTVTRRGRFDFASLLEDGDVVLAPGQSITVPMTPHARVLDSSSSVSQQADSLTQALRKSFSVITENESFARVTIADQIRFG